MRWRRREAERASEAQAQKRARWALRRHRALKALRGVGAVLALPLRPLLWLGAKLPKPKQLPKWVAVLPVIAIIGGLAYASVQVGKARRAGGQQSDALFPAPVKLEEDIEVRFEDVRMAGRERGLDRWDLEGPRVRLSKDGRFTFFDEKPHGNFYHLKDWQAKQDQPATRTRSLVWRGDQARYDAFDEVLLINGHAHVVTDGKDTIETERMEYSQRTKQIEMPKPVKIAMADGTKVTCDAMTANTEGEVFEFKGKVRMIAPMKGGGM